MITIKITGLEKAIEDLSKYTSELMDQALSAGLDEAADYVLQEMKNNTPVDTGNLRESEKITKPSELVRVIAPNPKIAPYAPFVELGHHTRSGSFVPGQFYVERTAVESRRGISQIMIRVLNNFLK